MPNAKKPKTILCIHSFTGAGRSSLSIILPVLAAMGHQVICLPTAVLSTHTGGLGTPARLADPAYAPAALAHYAAIGLEVDCIYAGYMADAAQAQLVLQAFKQWPNAFKVLDPAMGDNGRMYASLSADVIPAMGQAAAGADLILPNLTETHLLLGQPMPEEPDWTPDTVQSLAEGLLDLTPAVVVTGIPMGKYVGCVGVGRERFAQRQLMQSRSYHGTGDLFAAVLIGLLLRGNALSAAVEGAAAFVSQSILNTAPDADPRLGVWFEPLLYKLTQQPF